MHPTQRSLSRRAASVGALALAVPILASCGFDEATNEVYTPAVGTFSRDADVDVLGAVVVSTEGGEGTFVATFANKDSGAPAVVESLGGALTASELEPLELPAGGAVNLAADDRGVPVSGDFEIGQFIEVEIGYGNGQDASLEVPVVPNAGDYAGLDGPVPTETEDFDTDELYTPADEVVPGGSEED